MRACLKLWLRRNFWLVLPVFVLVLFQDNYPLELPLLGVAFALFACSRRFLTPGSTTNAQDSLRYIMSLPFSRKAIARSYAAGVCFIGLGAILIAAIILWATFFPLHKHGMDILEYNFDAIRRFLIFSCYTAGFMLAQWLLLGSQKPGRVSNYLMISIVAVFPGVQLLHYPDGAIENIFNQSTAYLSAEAMERWKEYLRPELADWGFSDLYIWQISTFATQLLTLTVYAGITLAAVCCMCYSYRRARQRFMGEEEGK